MPLHVHFKGLISPLAMYVFVRQTLVPRRWNDWVVRFKVEFVLNRLKNVSFPYNDYSNNNNLKQHRRTSDNTTPCTGDERQTWNRLYHHHCHHRRLVTQSSWEVTTCRAASVCPSDDIREGLVYRYDHHNSHSGHQSQTSNDRLSVLSYRRPMRR